MKPIVGAGEDTEDSEMALLKTAWFRLLYRPNPSLPLRFAVSVRKKVGNACQRNRERRQIRESLRQARELWPQYGWMVVIIDRKSPPHLTGTERQAIIRGLLSRIKELTDKNSQ